jgi:CubicO group peptidase (beta-lactamase class C family)
MRFALCLFAFVAACGSSTPTARPADPEPLDPVLGKRVDAVLDAAVAEQRIVGAVVLIKRDGKLVYHRAVGYADREAKRPMEENAIFLLASMSKPIVSMAMLTYTQRGQFSLDTPVTKYMPELTPRFDGKPAAPITVRHLLTHTSGFSYTFAEPPDGPYHQAGISDGLDAPGRSFADNEQRLLSVPLVAAPGTAFHYSLSIDVLGEMLARMEQMSLAAVVLSRVTKPLGMIDTGFTIADRDRVAVPYANQASGPPVRITDGMTLPMEPSGVTFAPSRIFDKGSYQSGGAGMAGTAHDYLVFLENLRLNLFVLDPDVFAALGTDQLGTADHRELGPGMGWGLLSAIVVDPKAAGSPAHAGTLGWGGAYGHNWWIDPEAKLSVVLMTNTTFEGMAGKLPGDLQTAVYSE